MRSEEQEKLNIELASYFELLSITQLYNKKVVKYKDALYTFDTGFKGRATVVKLELIFPCVSGLSKPKKEVNLEEDKNVIFPKLVKWIVGGYDKAIENVEIHKKQREQNSDIVNQINQTIRQTNVDIQFDGQNVRVRVGTSEKSLEQIKKIIEIMKE